VDEVRFLFGGDAGTPASSCASAMIARVRHHAPQGLADGRRVVGALELHAHEQLDGRLEDAGLSGRLAHGVLYMERWLRSIPASSATPEESGAGWAPA
jgi:hypothetical protein